MSVNFTIGPYNFEIGSTTTYAEAEKQLERQPPPIRLSQLLKTGDNGLQFILKIYKTNRKLAHAILLLINPNDVLDYAIKNDLPDLIGLVAGYGNQVAEKYLTHIPHEIIREEAVRGSHNKIKKDAIIAEAKQRKKQLRS